MKRLIALSLCLSSPLFAQDIRSTVPNPVPVVQGGTGVTTSTGSGSVVLSANPTITGTLGASAISASSTITGTALIPSGSSVPSNGVYLPSANAVGIATNSTTAMTIDSSQNVGIGGASSGNPLEISSNIDASIRDTTYVNSNVGASFIGQKARGTISSPSQALASDALASIIGRGYQSGGAFGNNVGSISILAAENFTSSSQGSDIAFATTTKGATSRTERVRIFASGGMSLNNTTDPGAGNLSVTGSITSTGGFIGAGSAPTPSGTCSINTQLGGNTIGSFKANGTCTNGTVILTFATTATNGWACEASDLTTRADAVQQTAYTTTTATFTGTMVSADLVTFHCFAF